MSMLILESCINCGNCEPQCPNNAIATGDSYYVIDSVLCTECVGAASEATCVQVCPVPDTIIVDPAHVETHEQLLARYQQMHPA